MKLNKIISHFKTYKLKIYDKILRDKKLIEKLTKDKKNLIIILIFH